MKTAEQYRQLLNVPWMPYIGYPFAKHVFLQSSFVVAVANTLPVELSPAKQPIALLEAATRTKSDK